MHRSTHPLRSTILSAAPAFALAFTLAALAVTAPAFAAEKKRPATVALDIQAQPLAAALNAFARQSGLRLIFFSEIGKGINAPRVSGTLSPENALSQLLANTALNYEFVDERTVAIRTAAEGRESSSAGSAAAQMRLAAIEAAEQVKERTDEKAQADVLVEGERIRTTEVQRTVDDPKPFYIFDAETIERSGATSLDDFLSRKLTMNSNYQNSSSVGILGNGLYSLTTGTVKLRGLTAMQTLILVNGRRIPLSSSGSTDQASDINSIPLGMIERVEVLPSAASGIHGAGALGGVINIITKRRYTGGDVRASYDNSFDTDTAKRRFDLNYGFTIEGGRTQIMTSAGYSDANYLQMRDRLDLFNENHRRVRENNPGFLIDTSPVIATTPRIFSGSGGPLRLRNNQQLTSTSLLIPRGYRGLALDGYAPLAANDGVESVEWADTPQYSHGLREALNNVAVIKAARAEVRRQMMSRLEAFFEASHDINDGSGAYALVGNIFSVPGTVATNPFTESVAVLFPYEGQGFLNHVSERTRLGAGVTLKFGRGWQATADYAWNLTGMDLRSRNLDAIGMNTAINGGQVNLFTDILNQPDTIGGYLRDSHTSLSRQFLYESSLRASGPLGRFLGMEPVLTTGLTYREEGRGRFVSETTYPNRAAANTLTATSGQSQIVRSAYAELTLPVVGAGEARPGLHQLDLQLTGRRDEYKVSGNRLVIGTGGVRTEYASTNPTLGLRYKPAESVMFRVAYAKGFIAPTYLQLTPNLTPPTATSLVDPRRGNTRSSAFVTSGGNPDLEPELGENWTGGVVLTPAPLPGLRIALDYTTVRKTNNIGPLSAPLIIANEAFFPDRVTRETPAAGDPYGVGRITAVNATQLNLNATSYEAYDLSVEYPMPGTSFGNFTVSSLATFQPHYRQRVTFGAPMEEFANVPAAGGPLHFRANATLSWERGGWYASWTTYFYGAYRHPVPPLTGYTLDSVVSQGGPGVSSQQTHDLMVSYHFSDAPRAGWAGALFDKTELQLGIRNVFNTAPAFDAFEQSPYLMSPFLDYRLATYVFSLRRGF